MRCLHCGKELALLRRLTGHGDFCSEDHKQSYQEEYNRLALSRLLQAQKKGQQANNSPVQNAAPPPDASVAVEEPFLEVTANRAADPPAREADLTEDLTQSEELTQSEDLTETEALAQATPEAAIDVAEVEESPTEAVDPDAPLGAEPGSLEPAGFLFESPTISALPEETPYLEPWLELLPGPAMSEWQIQNGASNLSSADLLALDLRPTASTIEDGALSADFSPQPFASAQTDLCLPVAAPAKKMASTNRLTAGAAIAVDIAPGSMASTEDDSFVPSIQFEQGLQFEPDLPFESLVQFANSQLLELPPTVINFPAEDSDVVLARSHSNSLALAPSAGEMEAPPVDNSPRASLEALSRLHQELVEQETVRVAEAAPMQATTAAEPAEPVEVPVEVVTAEVPATPVAVPGDGPETPAAEEPRQRFATELFEISIKISTPAKPALIGGDAFPSQVAPLLPHLKFLPLRPKMAIATGYVPPSQASAVPETKPATPAATAVRTQAPPKGAAVKPAARLTQPKQPTPAAKPAQPPATKTPEPRTPAIPKAALPKADVTKPAAKPAASRHTPVQEAVVAESGVPEAAPKTPPVEKEQASKPAPAADTTKPAAETTKPAADTTKPAADTTKPAADAKPAADQPKPVVSTTKPKGDQVNPRADLATKDDVPHFGIAQPANVPWAGSLKVKLGIAIVLLVIACAYFLGWGGGKSGKLSGSSTSVATDGSGPSIIMGEGGWVEGWGGDPSGMHVGRQITIYRPSLKLSDYRLEFQATIDTKSIGWVFRAPDPNNYYAMKLMTVSSGLSPKVALFKYLVVNGKQTQVGRVPIDLAVQPDTVFNVRVDVRGPQFTTYIQGQQVDSWTDDQLKVGGVGFLNERDERGKVKSVSIRYLSGANK